MNKPARSTAAIITDSPFAFVGLFTAIHAAAAFGLIAEHGANPLLILGAVVFSAMTIICGLSVAEDVSDERRAALRYPPVQLLRDTAAVREMDRQRAASRSRNQF